MLIVFFDVRGIVHGKVLLLSQMINQQVYKEILWHMLCSVYEKSWKLWQYKSWLLRHDMHLLPTA